MNKLIREAIEAFARGRKFVNHDVWHVGLPGAEIPQGFARKQVRVAILLARGIIEETLLLRATALTFATMLFIVPFLILMFSFIQMFNLGEGVYEAASLKVNSFLGMMLNTGAKAGADQSTEQSADEGEGEGDGEGDGEGEEKGASVTNDELRNRIITMLMTVVPKGLIDESKGQDPVKFLVGLAENVSTNSQTLGVTALLFLLSTILGFMRNVQNSFNSIWGVQRTKSFLRTISDYFLITLLLPFVVAGVLGVSAALASETITSNLGYFLHYLLRGGQFFTIFFAFSLLYLFVPNTRVKPHYALLGGFIASLLWIFCSWAYVHFQFGLAKNNLFFSGFATVPLLLMWIYVSWLILLFGALLTYAFQNEKTFAMERLAEHASYAYREAVAVRTAVDMARRFKQGLPGLSVQATAGAWNVPTRLLNETLGCLIDAKLATACATEPVTYQPARPPESTRVSEIVRAVREAGQDPSLLRDEEAYRPLYMGLANAESAYLESTLNALSEKMCANGEATPDAQDET